MGKKMKLPFLCKNEEPLITHQQPLQLSSCMQPNSLIFQEEREIYTGDHSTESMIIRGLKSERLFFDPNGTRSLVCKREPIISDHEGIPFEKISVAWAMDSADPYGDFRKSMEEMVEINGLRDWESLEELLGWYLRMNGKMHHGFIVGAFADLLVGVSMPPCSDSATSYSSLFSSSSSSSSSSPPISPSMRARRKRDLRKKTKNIM
ncbi:transcription repressor OFP13-like [Impatiens glandulifera]|uniref:transcription repressor OFP13-like n=1 Tax=Impatiens glandulifera TaxID=253017 RepID=UPI001FB05572|nr:transcription repressor OFP13-like [Impatiens glandulifera]